MRLAVIGSGELARTLTHRLARAGHDVNKADLCRFIKCDAHATVETAVASAEVVFLDIHFGRHTELPPPVFVGKIVVDATDYYAPRDGPIPALDQGTITSSQMLARHLSGARLVKALNAVNLLCLGEVGPLSCDVTPLAIPVAADDLGARSIVDNLIIDLGFIPAPAGGLAGSWRMQPGLVLHGFVATPAELRRMLELL